MNNPLRWQNEIEMAYAASGNRLGWRLLYSPPHVLDGAKVAFLGLNPGGTYQPEDHADFATYKGSAFVTESWEHNRKHCNAGENPLQIQVRKLFALLRVCPQDVLAGNLVPFRAPDWKSLANRKAALQFGARLWKEIFEQAKPELIICMGGDTRETLVRILQVDNLQSVQLNWGNIAAVRGTFLHGSLVALPHLSRYRVMGRRKSELAIQTLFSRT